MTFATGGSQPGTQAPGVLGAQPCNATAHCTLASSVKPLTPMQGIQEGLVTRGQDVSVAAGEISALCNQREPVLEVHTSPLSCFRGMETLQSQAKL